MRYTVIWSPSAERRLAQLWVDAADRDAVTTAADAIDVALRRDPLKHGESRHGAIRFLFMSPLCVYFDVEPADRLVTVRAVWRRGGS